MPSRKLVVMCVVSERIRRAVVAGAGSGGGSGWVRARIVGDGVVKPRRAELPVQRCGAKADPTELAQAPSRRRHSDPRPAMTSFLTLNSLSAPFPSLLRTPHCTPIPTLYFFLGTLFFVFPFFVFLRPLPHGVPLQNRRRCAAQSALLTRSAAAGRPLAPCCPGTLDWKHICNQ